MMVVYLSTGNNGFCMVLFLPVLLALDTEASLYVGSRGLQWNLISLDGPQRNTCTPNALELVNRRRSSRKAKDASAESEEKVQTVRQAFSSEPCCCRDLGFLNLQSLQLFKSRTSRIWCTQCASAQVLWELAEKLLRCAFASRTAFGSIGSSWALWSQCQLASLSTIFNKRSELFVSILWLAGDG